MALCQSKVCEMFMQFFEIWKNFTYNIYCLWNCYNNKVTCEVKNEWQLWQAKCFDRPEATVSHWCVMPKLNKPIAMLSLISFFSEIDNYCLYNMIGMHMFLSLHHVPLYIVRHLKLVLPLFITTISNHNARRKQLSFCSIMFRNELSREFVTIACIDERIISMPFSACHLMCHSVVNLHFTACISV